MTAQALHLFNHGERFWLNDEEIQTLIEKLLDDHIILLFQSVIDNILCIVTLYVVIGSL
jgi:hypothetical protein